MNRSLLTILIACWLTLMPGTYPVRHAHGSPHVHGTAIMSLLQERTTLIITFESPGVNIVGFEHLPQDEGESQKIANAIEILREPDNIIVSTATGCELMQAAAITTGAFSEAAQGDEAHIHNRHAHAGFRSVYEFNCKGGTPIQNISITAFNNFPGIETIEIQWVLNQLQGGLRLQSPQTRVRLQ